MKVDSQTLYVSAWTFGCLLKRFRIDAEMKPLSLPAPYTADKRSLWSGIFFQVRAGSVEGEADHVIHIQVTVKPQSSCEGHAVAHCVSLELILLKNSNIAREPHRIEQWIAGAGFA